MQVQNAVEFLKMIGALDEKENLTNLGMFEDMPICHVSMPPKRGFMWVEI